MNRYTAEFFGTLVLVFAGVGSAVLAGQAIGKVKLIAASGSVPRRDTNHVPARL